jgi:hypothetical protein
MNDLSIYTPPGMPGNPAVKIQMMRASLRCLVFGILSLLPFIGVAFALAAGWSSARARAKEKYFWNPAKPQRVFGVICAIFGALIWTGVDTVCIVNLCNNYYR